VGKIRELLKKFEKQLSTLERSKMISAKFISGTLPSTNSRFTERQLDHYRTYGQATMIRTGCLSGAFIGVKSSTKTVEIELEIKGRARNYLGLDVEVDNVVIKSLRMDLLPEMKKVTLHLVEFPDEKERLIKVYLPVSVEVDIFSFSADGKPLKRPEKRLLFLGDSITQGMDAVSPVCTYPVICAKILNMDFINQGVGGYVFDSESLDENFPFEPDIITVAYGVNDWNKDKSDWEINQAASTYLEKLKAIFKKAKVFVITPIWTDKEDQKKAAGTLQDLRKNIEDAAKKTGCYVINGLSLVPNNNFYFVDGIHPNETGHLIYGANLACVIREQLK